MHILIVDDEPPAARRVERLLREHISEPIQSLKMLHGVEPAVYYLQEHPVDLVFLDLEIAEDSGFDLLIRASSNSFHTIIVSGHPEGAVQAFDHQVVDFVTKPVKPERFIRALERLQTARRRGIQRQSLTLPGEDGTEIIEIDSIETIRSEGNYCLIGQYDGTEKKIRKTLSSMEQELGSEFLRTHKSCIIRKSDIVRILSAANNTFVVELRSEKRMPLSRSAREDLRSGL
jgi:DNA-binding LytR/AlgR family response regulator